MRYTTPEWLLENLERRLRLALKNQVTASDELSFSPTNLADNFSADARLSASVQRAS